MKINLQELGKQAIENTTGSQKMRLSENAASMVFQLFTKNVYSNPIGTVVREITSNCFDSHVEAKVNTPVIIKKSVDKQTGEISISFIDFGVGMSPERIDNIYGVYFESTKRVDNAQIGGFGIGGKSPLAYKRSTGSGEGEYDNSFYVITIFNNIKYYYCMYEGADSPVISLLHSEATTERNGTEVRIPVLSKDVTNFTREMVKQLYYFENIIFEGFENDNSSLSDNYQIVRGKNFLFRNKEYSDYAHICLGKVAYPIDYGLLGLYQQDYKLPIALRLEVGEVNVTVSRESIDYSEATIKMLKLKLTAAKNEIVQMLTKQYANTNTLEDYFKIKNEFGSLVFPNGISMYVGNLIKFNTIDFTNFKYASLGVLNDKALFQLFFNVRSYGKKKNRWGNNEFEGGYADLKKATDIMYVDGMFNRKVIKQSYLKSIHERYHIISRKNVSSIDNGDIIDAFNRQFSSVNLPQSNILNEIADEYWEIVKANSKDYDAVVVTDDFINDRKNRKVSITTDLRNTTISLTLHASYPSKDTIKLGALFNYNMPIFYGTMEDESALITATQQYKLLFNQNIIATSTTSDNNSLYSYNGRGDKKNEKMGIAFVQLSKTNVKYMKFCKKAYHVSEFSWRMLYRKETIVRESFYHNSIRDQYDNLNSLYTNKNFKSINSKLAAKVNMIKNHIDASPAKSVIDTTNSYIKQAFNLDDAKMTNEQSEIIKLLKEVQGVENLNKDTLQYISMPRYRDTLDVCLVELLKKALVF